MYLLSPEGKTVIHIPGVEVVHSIQEPINIPGNRLVQIKMEPGKMQPPQGGSRKRPLGLSLDLNSASAKKEASAESSDIARCANVEADLSGIGEVFKSKPHPGHTHSVWLHISQISDGGAGNVR